MRRSAPAQRRARTRRALSSTRPTHRSHLSSVLGKHPVDRLPLRGKTESAVEPAAPALRMNSAELAKGCPLGASEGLSFALERDSRMAWKATAPSGRWWALASVARWGPRALKSVTVGAKRVVGEPLLVGRPRDLLEAGRAHQTGAGDVPNLNAGEELDDVSHVGLMPERAHDCHCDAAPPVFGRNDERDGGACVVVALDVDDRDDSALMDRGEGEAVRRFCGEAHELPDPGLVAKPAMCLPFREPPVDETQVVAS